MLVKITYNYRCKWLAKLTQGGDIVKKTNKIREFRLKRNLKQIELAEKLNVTRYAVTQWETGRNLPRAEMLVQLSKILKCKIEDLIC